ncbi:MAG: hypothetical protein V4558_06695 [Gemmatimonadota bacterium]
MGAAAAAVIVRKEKELVAHLREVGATSAETARSLSSMQVNQESFAFRRLQQRAVVRQASSGGWYLDELSWEAVRAMRRRMAMLLITVVVVGGLMAYFATAASR